MCFYGKIDCAVWGVMNSSYNNNKHIIIVHRERESCDVLDKTINTLIEKEYGRSKIIFGVFK